MRISPCSHQLAVGLRAGDLELGLAVGVEAAALEVDDEQAAGVQAAAAADLGRVDREHARPRSRTTTTPSSVTSQRPGRRPLRSRQAPSDAPVGEGHRRGAVPGLEHRGACSGRSRRAPAACRRARCARRGSSSSSRAAAGGRRAASSSSTRSKAAESELPSGISGRQSLEVVAEELGVQRRLAGPHPVDVAGDRVDLAVVGEQAQRLGELPAREGVGREARVDDRERALQLGVAQVGVEAGELRAR